VTKSPYYLSSDAEILHSKAFESGVMKDISGRECSLSKEEKKKY
jgi:hypothetical protein